MREDFGKRFEERLGASEMYAINTQVGSYYRCGHHLRNWQLRNSASNFLKNKKLTMRTGAQFRGVSLFIFSLAFLNIYSKNLAIRTDAGFGGANKPRASRKIRVS